MRLTLLSLFMVFVTAAAQAAPLTLGVVLDQNETISNPETEQRYRNFAGDIEQVLGQQVRIQYFKSGF